MWTAAHVVVASAASHGLHQHSPDPGLVLVSFRTAGPAVTSKKKLFVRLSLRRLAGRKPTPPSPRPAHEWCHIKRSSTDVAMYPDAVQYCGFKMVPLLEVERFNKKEHALPGQLQFLWAASSVPRASLATAAQLAGFSAKGDSSKCSGNI